MVDVNTGKIQEIKKLLSNSSVYFNKNEFIKIMQEFNEDEIISFFDDEMIKYLEKIDSYDILSYIFRVVPSTVQELIWSIIYCKKILLGLGTASDEELEQAIINKKFFNMQVLPKKERNGKFCYNPIKLRALEVLFKHIKSQNILDSLVNDKYFYMILLCCKKVSDNFYDYVNVRDLFENIINSDIYSLVDNKNKAAWLCQINCNCPKLLLPYDFRNIFDSSNSFTYYYRDHVKTLGSMINSKLYNLGIKGLKIDIDRETLDKLNLNEINILKSTGDNVVDQNLIDELLKEIVDKSFYDGTIFKKKYLDVAYLDFPVQKTIFKLVVGKAVGNPQYEEKVLNYLFGLLFKEEYDDTEKKYILLSLKNSIVNSDEETLSQLFKAPNDLKSIFFLRFNLTARNMDYLYGISVRQLMFINVKHINRIVKLLFDPEQDELSDSYSKAIKMYFVFGLEKTIEILSGKYPIDGTFTNNVCKLDVRNVSMKKEGNRFLPIINTDFNRFMFVANNINAAFDKDSALYYGWYYLYNNFESIKSECGGHVNLAQAETILREQVHNVKYELEPDCYRLDRILYLAGLGNKTPYSNEEIYDEICRIHRKQIKRVESTIPYVSGKLDNGWSYEVMRHEDAVAFVLGYKANCCIRTKDIAHNHLLHALLCENGRILLTFKPDGTIASFSPLKRNGEVLIANSIETIEKDNNWSSNIVEAFECGMKEIQRVSKESEEKNCIKVLTIGTSSLIKPNGESWPYNLPKPTILEKDDLVYADTDIYHKNLLVFYKDEKTNLSGLRYGKVKKKYLDPRKEIIFCVNDKNNLSLKMKAQKIIDSIRYTIWIDNGNNKEDFEKTNLKYFDLIVCNDDWYVFVDYYGLHYECLKDDFRAKNEMEAVIEVIQSYKNNKQDIKKLILDYNK